MTSAETALIALDWVKIDENLATQHRLTHALANALAETRDAITPAFRAEVDRRIVSIIARRADQQRRLVTFNHEVKERLAVIARSRGLRRVNLSHEPPSRILDTLQ